MSGHTVRAALVQAPWTRDQEPMLKAHEEHVREAAAQGATATCFQELFCGPYLYQEQEAKHFAHVESVPGPMSERLTALAAEMGMAMVLRVPEGEQLGVVYNTAAAIEADGSYLSRCIKTLVPQVAGLWEELYVLAGSLGYPVFDTAVGKVGVYICYEFCCGWHFRATTRALSNYRWKVEKPVAAVADQLNLGAINRVGMEELRDDDRYGTSHFVDPEGVRDLGTIFCARCATAEASGATAGPTRTAVCSSGDPAPDRTPR